jgi:hypothetical protein
MRQYQVAHVSGRRVCGTLDKATILELLDGAERVQTSVLERVYYSADDRKRVSETKPRIRGQTDYWVEIEMVSNSLDLWAVAYFCRQGWEPFTAEGDEYYFRRTVEA